MLAFLGTGVEGTLVLLEIIDGALYLYPLVGII